MADGLCFTRALDAASKVTEQEWREKAKKDLEEWNLRQNEQMEKNRANNRYVGVSRAKRTVCLPGMFGGLFPHSGAQPCRDRALPSKGRDPRSRSGSSGCAEPPWLGPHWDHHGILVPPAPVWGSQGGRVGLQVLLVCCSVWVTLFGRTNPPLFSLSNPLPACRSAPLSLSLCPRLGSLTKPFTSSRTPMSLATCMCLLQTISCLAGSGGPGPSTACPAKGRGDAGRF